MHLCARRNEGEGGGSLAPTRACSHRKRRVFLNAGIHLLKCALARALATVPSLWWRGVLPRSSPASPARPLSRVCLAAPAPLRSRHPPCTRGRSRGQGRGCLPLLGACRHTYNPPLSPRAALLSVFSGGAPPVAGRRSGARVAERAASRGYRKGPAIAFPPCDAVRRATAPAVVPWRICFAGRFCRIHSCGVPQSGHRAPGLCVCVCMFVCVCVQAADASTYTGDTLPSPALFPAWRGPHGAPLCPSAAEVRRRHGSGPAGSTRACRGSHGQPPGPGHAASTAKAPLKTGALGFVRRVERCGSVSVHPRDCG